MIVDLSMAIQPHWRWKIVRECPLSHEKGDGIQATVFSLPMHAFTHVDTPLHILPDQITIDRVALENLAGPAAVLDFTGIGPNQPITLESARKAGMPSARETLCC